MLPRTNMQPRHAAAIVAALLLVIVTGLGHGPAVAATFCVDTAAELQAALTAAEGNAEDDTVQVVQGLYVGNFIYNDLVALDFFAYPPGLLALLGVPAVVALHLYRRRFQPQRVSALFLWGLADRTPLSGRTRERLQRSPASITSSRAHSFQTACYADLSAPGEHCADTGVLDDP